jgi:diguanylate cyclase
VRQNLTENSESTAILLSKLLSLTLSLAVSTLLHNTPELAKISDQLSDEVKSVEAAPDLQSIESRLKTLFLQITLNVEDTTEQLQLLLTLFQLLLENVGNLLDDDNWLRGQVLVIKALIAGHIDHRSLIDATKSLKEVIYKQGELKDCIAQNRVSVKQMMDLFVERLGLFAETTGDYHLKIASYSKQISETSDVSQVNLVLESVMTDTLLVQSETKKSHSLMVEAQKEVRDAETRIRELEQKLAEMSEQVHKDQLTGSLNRRGLDDIFEREAARADRRGTPLCVGLLDLDNFKRINDLHGHSTGDEALMHLVKVVKQTLRSMDVIARYGGEEFVIIMPETTLTDAADTMTRVQRELTRHFFMVGNERLLITFSAGVTIRELHEDQDSVVKRADKAMYAAKKAGKNRVVIADTCDTLE